MEQTTLDTNKYVHKNALSPSVLSLVEIASIATLSSATQLSITTCPLATQTSLVVILSILSNATPKPIICIVAHDKFSTNTFTKTCALKPIEIVIDMCAVKPIEIVIDM